MTIDKAIEILERFMNCVETDEPLDFDNAVQLGIEALKRTKAQYDPDHQMMRIPLLGETSD